MPLNSFPEKSTTRFVLFLFLLLIFCAGGVLPEQVKDLKPQGYVSDFARVVDPQSRALVLDVLADTGHAEFVIARVREAIEHDPHVAGRLALWARRLVGEALAQAHRVAAERGPLARLLASGAQGGSAGELGEIARMFARITDEHAQRMAALGLANWGSAPARD